MPEFSYTDLLPLGADGTSYRRLTGDGVMSHGSFGRKFTEIEPQVLTDLTAAAMHDIAHLLRPAHLAQLRSILEDPEASPNEVALYHRDYIQFVVVTLSLKSSSTLAML